MKAARTDRMSASLAKQAWGIVFLLAGGAIAIGWWASLPEPNVLSSVEATTEHVAFKVLDPVRAAFYLPATDQVSAQNWALGPTVSGLVTPAAGTTVTYRRNEGEFLTVELSPAGASTIATGKIAPVFDPENQFAFWGRVGFRIKVAEPMQFPIWGQLTLGQEFAPPALPQPPSPRLLLKGKLTVTGVSEGQSDTSLYPIADIDLPVGSRLSSSGVDGGVGPIWWGTVTAGKEATALELRAVSETRRINLYRPGRVEPDEIVVSRTAKLTQDPRLIRQQLTTLAAIAGIGLLLSLGQRLYEALTSAVKIWQRKRSKTYRNKGVPKLALAVTLLLTGTAQAQIVLLKVGDNRTGQGWMFWDTDRLCKVVTARHVILGTGAALRSPTLVDGRNVRHETGPAIVNSERYDVAVLPVIASDPGATCGGGRLSVIGLERRVRTSTRVVVDTTGEKQVRHVPASLVAIPRDDFGGEMMMVRLDADSGEAREGWSGSAVLDAEGPIGIVQNLWKDSATELLAVRMDVVRRLMDAAPAPVPPVAVRPIIEVTSGDVVGLSNGNGGEGWRFRPAGGRVAFVLTFPAPVEIRGVVLRIGAGSAEGAGIETIADPARPDSVGESVYLRGSPDSAYRMRVSPRTVRQIRVTIRAGGAALDVAGVEVF